MVLAGYLATLLQHMDQHYMYQVVHADEAICAAWSNLVNRHSAGAPLQLCSTHSAASQQ